MSLLDKNIIHQIQHPRPDFLISELNPDFKKISTEFSYKKNFEIENEFLLVELTATYGDMLLKYHLKMFVNSGAVQHQIFLKGNTRNHIWEREASEGSPMIENISIGTESLSRIGILPGLGLHASYEVVNFKEATDYHDQPVRKSFIKPFRQPQREQGNMLIVRSDDQPYSMWLLKESPINWSQNNYPGFDFTIFDWGAGVSGFGITPKELQSDSWTPVYAYTRNITLRDQFEEQKDWLNYQMQIRRYVKERDAMLLANTWGDRSKDGRMNESFILKEIDYASKIGMTHLQLDDGWQQGLSKNSASKSGLKWDDWSVEDWQPHRERFPNGFSKIIEEAKLKDVKLCLWFNPSKSENYKNWESDADILVDYYNQYGITVFKIDGLELGNKQSENNVRNFFDKVMQATDGQVTFNLDVTAGKRIGYHFMQEYGNIFLENRYTDWGNYFPYRTLRNLWLLAAYVPSSKLQIEWLNVFRNQNRYQKTDIHSPNNVGVEYAYVSTWAAQPLAWMELSSLNYGVKEVSRLTEQYRKISENWHQNVVLPIGLEPSGFAWSGFWIQTPQESQDYLLVYKEASESDAFTYILPRKYAKATALNVNSDQIKISGDQLSVSMNGKYQFAIIELIK
ncbi:alpha-galactosidase [Belliella pelovolcani]|nr:alpha-galactosidase [Belliella pelovolcani]